MTVETTPPKSRKGMSALFSKKVYGVPVVYIVVAFVLILAIVAWKIKPSADLVEGDAEQATDAETDAANASGSELFPGPTTGTVVVQPTQPAVPEAEYESNDDWMRKAVSFLIAKNINPGTAQVALQTYLAGDDLTVEQGKIRDMVVKEYGLPPEIFTVGNTAITPPKVTSPVTTPPVVKPKPTPQPAPKPVPPAKRIHVVRSGENLTVIGRKYARTWQQIYNANRGLIKNPNLIYPGQRLVIP